MHDVAVAFGLQAQVALGVVPAALGDGEVVMMLAIGFDDEDAGVIEGMSRRAFSRTAASSSTALRAVAMSPEIESSSAFSRSRVRAVRRRPGP